jgi:hypothetical protein
MWSAGGKKQFAFFLELPFIGEIVAKLIEIFKEVLKEIS